MVKLSVESTFSVDKTLCKCAYEHERITQVGYNEDEVEWAVQDAAAGVHHISCGFLTCHQSRVTWT